MDADHAARAAEAPDEATGKLRESLLMERDSAQAVIDACEHTALHARARLAATESALAAMDDVMSGPHAISSQPARAQATPVIAPR